MQGIEMLFWIGNEADSNDPPRERPSETALGLPTARLGVKTLTESQKSMEG
jgi:hypothetical protein